MLQIGNEKAYNTNELAQVLSTTKPVIRRMINQGKLQAEVIGKEKYVKASEVKKYLETLNTK